MATAHINIGSNIGDRHAVIGMAVAAIERRFGVEVVVSSPVDTPSWGYESPNDFVNVGLNVEIGELEPEMVMEILLDIQRTIDSGPHRDSSGGYIDRVIDIDLIAIDDVVWLSDNLILPHPRMSLRRFVLEPMVQILPEWRHPATGFSPMEMLRVIEQE